jgi:4-amino-4-deoxy-L-arabinose transferase-like glycosyltransferase
MDSDAIWNIPHSFGPDSFIEPGISVCKSGVPISFVVHLLISLSVGGHFLKPTSWMLMLYFQVATSLIAEWPFLLPFFVGATLLGQSWKGPPPHTHTHTFNVFIYLCNFAMFEIEI